MKQRRDVQVRTGGPSDCIHAAYGWNGLHVLTQYPLAWCTGAHGRWQARDVAARAKR